MGAFISQGWAGSPKHSVFLNNLVTHRNCESLKEIGKMACVTPAWSSRGQTYRSSFWGTISYFSFRALWFANDTTRPTFFLCSFNQNIQVKSKEVSFHRPQLVLALLLPNNKAENFPGFPLLCFLSIRSCFFNVIQLLSWCIGPLCHWGGRFFFSK